MKHFLYSLIIILLLPICILFSQEQKLRKINFIPMWVPQPQFAGYYVAKEKGFYEKYGLDVNIINGGYNHNVITLLKNSEADFGILYLSAGIQERALGTELVNIAQIFQHSGIMFVSKKTSGINSLKDFNGKKIALWRTILSELTNGFLKKHNIQAEVIRMNEGVNLFLKGAVDICAVMSYNEYNSLINYGINPDELNVFPFKDYGMDFPEDGIYCMGKTYDSDPDLCRDFANASIEGWQYALEHKEETLIIMQNFQKAAKVQINKTHSEWMLKLMKDMIYPAGKKVKMGNLLESDFNSIVHFFIENKDMVNKPVYDNFYKGSN